MIWRTKFNCVVFVIAMISCENSARFTNIKSEITEVDSVQAIKMREPIVFSCDYLGETPPEKEPRLFAPNKISTGDLHSSLYFSPDGRELYYSRLSSDGYNSGVLCRKFVNGKWTGPEVIRGTESALTPFISIDGMRLFCSLGSELFVLKRVNDNWSEPINLGEKINFQKRQDGIYESAKRTIYYSAMFGENDGIYYSEFINGQYQQPIKIETGLPQHPATGYSYVSPNEDFMIFQSRVAGGFGATDLYVMFKKNDGSWTKAINMGSKINTKASESFPNVTPDGKYFFFNSNRIAEINSKIPSHFYGDIYWIDASIIDKLKDIPKYD